MTSKAKHIIRKIMIITGLILIADTLLVSMLVNINFGTLMPAILGTPLLLWGIFCHQLNEQIEKQAGRGLLKVLVVLIKVGYISFILSFIIITSIILGSASRKPVPGADAVIVLGAGIRGEQVSLTLAHRLDKAMEYFSQNPETIIVVSGGRGPGEAISEAEAMMRYLKERGIPENKILIEDKSTSTYENFLYSKNLLDRRFGEGKYRAVFTTTDFHVYRASRVAKDVGLDAGGIGAKSLWYLIPNFYLREYLGVIKYWVLGY